MREIQIPSTDGIHQLHTVLWEPQGEVRGVVQISHGMVEYIERYTEFAEYLNKAGFAVIGNDHLGHGHTVNSDEELGYFCEKDMSATVVNDLHTVTKRAKELYPNVPYFLFGHSMGSFLARRYLMTYAGELTAAVICGTGTTPTAMLAGGRCLAALIGLFRGPKYRSELLKKASFGTYNARIDNPKSPNAWLSVREENVEKYDKDKYCTFPFTVNGYKTLLGTIAYIQKPANVGKIPKTLPIFLIAGAEDPVGAYGKGVQAVYEVLKKQGIKDLSIKLYPNDRHEILNETDRESVYADVAEWLSKYC